MRIGIGKKSGDGFTFEVRIPFLAPATLDLHLVEHPGERAPHWHILHGGERCGALWRRVPKGGGDAFLSGHIESPLFPGGKLEIAIFAAKEGSGQKDMVWRPRESERPATESHPSPASDGDEPF